MHINQEISQLASDLHHLHGQDIAELACMAYLSRSLLERFAQSHRTNVTPLIDWQRRVLFDFIERRGISRETMRDAIDGIERAGQTTRVLQQLDAVEG